MSASFRASLQEASTASSRYASLSYDIASYICQNRGQVKQLKVLAAKHSLKGLQTIATNNRYQERLVSLAAFEADLFLLLGLLNDDLDLPFWVRYECLNLTKLAKKLRTERPSAAEDQFLNLLAGKNFGWMMQVMETVNLINSQPDD